MTHSVDWEQPLLLDPGSATPVEAKIKTPTRPVWSESKADLIALYLKYFVYITKHGTYIDAFAGPQTDRSEQAWTARQVLESEPKRLRNFYLFDNDPQQVQHLKRLADDNSDRNVRVHAGDSNRVLPEVLPTGSIREREATFCLLDQRTFECQWQLCEHIARLRPGSMKVEQFYFLANSWLPRALAAVSTPDGKREVTAWLGRDDWRSFAKIGQYDRAQEFVDRFKNGLGYRFVHAWPIYERDAGGGRVMYYMIHASDHADAPKLMRRAYGKAVRAPEPPDQLVLDMS